MPRPTPDKPHHHGDLRNALVTAGLDLLREGGISALTLRGCAARAGVSHAAPKHHFSTAADLRMAIADACFVIFNTYMLKAAEAGPQTPRDRLRAICRGYLDFALENPAFFDAIFSLQSLPGFDSSPEADPGPSYLTLREACAPFVPAGQDPVVIETQVWSLIHGYTLLIRMGRFAGTVPEDGPFEDVMALLDRVGTHG